MYGSSNPERRRDARQAAGQANGQAAGRAGGQAGFTLLEVLVAFAILGVSLTALLQAFSGGLSVVRAAAGHDTAVMHARSKLEEVGPLLPLTPGEAEGAFRDGYVWRLRIELFDDGQSGQAPVAAYRVTVTVNGPGRGPGFSLTTLRLAARS